MTLTVAAAAHWNGIKVIPEPRPKLNQQERIRKALGLLGVHLPGVGEETLSRYYTYLTARLSFPFTAHYPEPTTSLEEVQHCCAVVELLDPANDICDEFDGIFCRTRKGNFEVNLPLTELHTSDVHQQRAEIYLFRMKCLRRCGGGWWHRAQENEEARTTNAGFPSTGRGIH